MASSGGYDYSLFRYVICGKHQKTVFEAVDAELICLVVAVNRR